MPSRLKSFELHGYKTFPSRTEFLFADGITAIVGPNGSGKSNIADALRWVLGEQSFGLLRAKKTEDMIFAGSEHRPRAGMASATIVFDNSDGWLPIDFSEVGITRRAYRDGDNEYLLNGQRVRLRDVSELLSRSGLAERTYTVIGQGLVDAALSLKAEERRRLFEEAAGIGLHRARRDEALRRLDATRRNLERVQDILVELQPRLRSLERQARRSLEYDQARTDLKILLREWYGYHWHLVQTELTEAKSTSQLQESALENARQEQTGLDKKLAIIRRQSLELRTQISDWNKKLSIAYSQREQLIREKAITDERTRSLEIQIKDIESEILRFDEENNFFQSQINSVSNDITRLEVEKDEAQRQVIEFSQELERNRKQVDEEQKNLQRHQQTLSTLLTRHSIMQTRLNELRTSRNQYTQDLEEAIQGVQQSEGELVNTQKLFQEAVDQREKDSRILSKTEETIKRIRQDISSLESKKRERLAILDGENARLTQLQTKLTVLRQAEEDLIGYAEGARLLLLALRDSHISGGRGALSNFLSVPDEFKDAISSALGEYLGVVLVNNWDVVEESLEILERESARGVLFVLEALDHKSPKSIDLTKFKINKGEIIGIGSEIVRVESDLKPVIDLLLGQVMIVKDRLTARRLLSNNDWSSVPTVRFVTLQGEIFHANGSVFSASSSGGILNRPQQRKAIETEIMKAEAEVKEIKASFTEVDGDLTKAYEQEQELTRYLQKASEVHRISTVNVNKFELSFEKAKQSLEWMREQVERIKTEIQGLTEEEVQITKALTSIEDEIQTSRTGVKEKNVRLETYTLDEVQDKVTYWQTQLAVFERAIEDAVTKKKERQESYARVNKTLQALRDRVAEMSTELVSLVGSRGNLTDRLSEATQETEDIRTLVSPAEDQLAQVESTLNQWVTTDLNVRQALSTAEHQYAQARINLSRKQEALESLRRRIEDDFGLVLFEYAQSITGPTPLPLDGMVEELPEVLQVAPDLEENVQRQRALLRRMGPVNPDAQAEFKEVKERFDFLTTQVSDLHKAESDIKEVIAELDLMMEREFRKTFDAVAQEFRQIFTRLFGGGIARLILTDPDDMTDTGIDIEARLPGRREQGLSLLSGGERSLTATALVFALLRISPTPFCIFDEVDAMLDEENVGRFRELLLELSENTQFIIITHNRNTVQSASVIYGVTMGRDSASQVISLKLDELTEEYGVQHG